MGKTTPEVRRKHYLKNREAQIARVSVRRARIEAENREFVSGLKSTTPCADCGVSYPPYVMDFDHVTGGKVSNVSAMMSNSRATLQAEIDKCEIVCSNCHRQRTHERMSL